jgi:hypothetical protein
MRALTAQRTALAGQIKQEAASIAAALESEAKIDDAQIAVLESQLVTLPASATADTASLQARATAQRAELDGLVDAYFNIPATSAAAPDVAPRNDLSVANLVVVAIAALVTIAVQILLAQRRRRAQAEADLDDWRNDGDVENEAEIAAEPTADLANDERKVA